MLSENLIWSEACADSGRHDYYCMSDSLVHSLLVERRSAFISKLHLLQLVADLLYSNLCIKFTINRKFNSKTTCTTSRRENRRPTRNLTILMSTCCAICSSTCCLTNSPEITRNWSSGVWAYTVTATGRGCCLHGHTGRHCMTAYRPLMSVHVASWEFISADVRRRALLIL